MKKSIFLLGSIIEIVWLIYVKFNLESLDILKYMLYSIVIPALIVFITSFAYSFLSGVIQKKYMYSVINSIIMATILTIFGLLFINAEIMNNIMLNTVTSNNVEVSISQAKASDNIQSYIIFIAVGGLGTLLGNKLSRKKGDKSKLQDEYDDDDLKI